MEIPAQLPPACIILDLCLPGLSGLELRKQLDAAGRMLPVIFITAHANEQVREQALQAGAVAFLSKPFNDQDLLDVLALGVGG